MKKLFYIITIFISTLGAFAQNNSSNIIFVRQDTIILKASESEWLIKSLLKNDSGLTHQSSKTLPIVILELIEKGTLNSNDPISNNAIPPKEIYSWKMPIDTLALYDEVGNVIYKIKQQILNPNTITQIRIAQDWYFNQNDGKFQCDIKWIELLREIYFSNLFVGCEPFCRIYY
ncbi:MAG: hypothetical protein Q8S44_05150 [Flavobacteriaceae bacterium]|nr:hypothetical protein [Flavobacteriaceae bacterium]